MSKSYGHRVALRDVSLDLYEGEILALLGPNGSGKTTLIKIFATLLQKDGGWVEIMGLDLDRDQAEIRRLFGYVGQDTDRSAYARLTVRENLEFFGALRGLNRRETAARTAELSSYFEFDEALDRLFMTLSGGQKQTALIIRALLADPVIAYLDEPTRGLDPLVSRRIRGFLRRYVAEQRKSVLLTSHALSEVEALANRVALIHRGAIAITSTAAELKMSLDVQGFLEIPEDALSPEIEAALTRNHARRDPGSGEPGWIAFGVGGDADGLAAILDAIRAAPRPPAFRYRSATLEDAFTHHVGVLDETFER